MRHLTLVLGLLASLGAAPAFAATETPYEQASFQAAQSANEPILVWVHASWCPTCAAQRPILSKLEADPANDKLKVFMVDFDRQKDVVRALGVQMQSTLIAYRGAKETGRSTGQTGEAAIRAVVAKTEG